MDAAYRIYFLYIFTSFILEIVGKRGTFIVEA